jgi:tetratricopeptide (TPR) repeat protein
MKKILFCVAIAGLILSTSAAAKTPWMRKHPDVSWRYLERWEKEHQWLTPAREGRIYFQKHEVGQARPLLEKAVEEGADDGRLLYELGYSCRVGGDNEAALDYLDRAARLLARDDPGHLYHFNALYLAGLIREERGEETQALSNYEEALRLRPDLAPLRYRKAYLLVRRGETSAAREEIARVLERDPGSGAANFFAGLLALESGDLTGAEQHLGRARSAGVEPGPVLYALGHVSLGRGDSEAAIARFEGALEADPGNRDALAALANLSYREDDLARARKYFQLLAAREPSAARWHYNLGVVYRDLGLEELSGQSLAEARRLDPELRTLEKITPAAAGPFNEAGELLEDGQPRAAIELYREALAADPFFIPAHYNLAIACRRAGEGRRALRQYDRLLRIDPDYGPARLNAGIIAVEQKDRPAAARHLRRYLELEPDSPQAGLVRRYLREMRGW